MNHHQRSVKQHFQLSHLCQPTAQPRLEPVSNERIHGQVEPAQLRQSTDTSSQIFAFSSPVEAQFSQTQQLSSATLSRARCSAGLTHCLHELGCKKRKGNLATQIDTMRPLIRLDLQIEYCLKSLLRIIDLRLSSSFRQNHKTRSLVVSPKLIERLLPQSTSKSSGAFSPKYSTLAVNSPCLFHTSQLRNVSPKVHTFATLRISAALICDVTITSARNNSFFFVAPFSGNLPFAQRCKSLTQKNCPFPLLLSAAVIGQLRNELINCFFELI